MAVHPRSIKVCTKDGGASALNQSSGRDKYAWQRGNRRKEDAKSEMNKLWEVLIRVKAFNEKGGKNPSGFRRVKINVCLSFDFIKFATVLGNHDYRGDVEAQLSPILTKMDHRWLCLRSFIVNAALRDSTAKWKIVVGHHTIKSAGQHGITIELEEQLLPILQANNIDLYVNGHDHCLEHICGTDSQIQFLTSGVGSKAWRGDIREWNPEELELYYDGQEFCTSGGQPNSSTLPSREVSLQRRKA
uniref:Calcineurin-like phosphoesterase domain-containing protein n=1 Tax=Quercus lobata TaxID=97700 RepID=A0A7N2R1D8_QUELO